MLLSQTRELDEVELDEVELDEVELDEVAELDELSISVRGMDDEEDKVFATEVPAWEVRTFAWVWMAGTSVGGALDAGVDVEVEVGAKNSSTLWIFETLTNLFCSFGTN